MNGRCVVCGKRMWWTRSRRYCARHYWRLRRLGEKSQCELERLAAEADHTKKLIAIILDTEASGDDVAELQRARPLPSQREE